MITDDQVGDEPATLDDARAGATVPETGDRPVPAGSAPILVDTAADPEVPEPQGDQVVANQVFLVRDDQRPTPTAGDYRAAGYMVPESADGPVPDDQVPGLVHADRGAPEGTVALVDAPVLPVGQGTEGPIGETATDSEATPEEAQGRAAAEAGQPRSRNPFDRRTSEGKSWARGWDAAQADRPHGETTQE